ncbi:hypothetical protein BC628DRAFT_784743 [Trametes gibbosa]|nr:hypothetical protein BC628DRAFT_784743 [Trametes gibbosa]
MFQVYAKVHRNKIPEPLNRAVGLESSHRIGNYSASYWSNLIVSKSLLSTNLRGTLLSCFTSYIDIYHSLPRINAVTHHALRTYLFDHLSELADAAQKAVHLTNNTLPSRTFDQCTGRHGSKESLQSPESVGLNALIVANRPIFPWRRRRSFVRQVVASRHGWRAHAGIARLKNRVLYLEFYDLMHGPG